MHQGSAVSDLTAEVATGGLPSNRTKSTIRKPGGGSIRR